MDLADKQIGAEGHVKVSIAGGKVSLVGSDQMKGLGIDLMISVDSDYFLDQLALAIPGTFDDAIIAIAKAALKAI